MSNSPLSLALDKIIGKLQSIKLSIGECSMHVHNDSDDRSHFALWQGDIEFMEWLVDEFMDEHGLKTDKTPSTHHINHIRKVTHVDPKLLNEEWIGREHSA